jgi:hypothetical protein
VPHFEHLTVSCKGVPQFEQNLAPAAFMVPHFGQGTPLGGCNDVPQLPQNFVFCGFWKPHLGHNTIGCA